MTNRNVSWVHSRAVLRTVVNDTTDDADARVVTLETLVVLCPMVEGDPVTHAN